MSSKIKVAIRIRPLISREKLEKLKEQWEVNENSMYPIDVTTGKRNGDMYHFDHIFSSTYCNADIYSTVVHPVVDKAMNGFNGTIFAYGQTSSGKTYTMMGNATEDGLISIAVQNIFLAIEQSVNRKFLLRVSYIEIYNEKIYDLLDTKNIVKISEDYSGSVIVNVKEEITDCAEKVYDVMKKGNKARRIGETDMNEKSSRSHTIFRIIIESSDISDTDVVNVAHLNLVDLAGSERAAFTRATGQRLKEGAHINKSLSTLSLVMKQLSESQDFINFRDSKLTRILQPSLGGNTLTAIICAVTPAALEETHSTLAFASRAKTVKNKPLLNEVVTDEALINRYALEINKLKKELEMANVNRTSQAQKIAILEKSILISKKTNNSNKNRRKTWSAPSDPNSTLPVIYETDVLILPEPTSSSKSNNLESEAFPIDDYLFEIDRSTPSPEKKELPESSLTSTESTQLSVTNGQPDKKYDDEVKWLINLTETPKSVLRERADYYEHEFKSLKELTTKERLLTTTIDNSELDLLISKLEQVKNELECERKIKKEFEIKFSDEKNLLQLNLDELKKKNDELSKIVQRVEKENEKKNDCEFLVEMYKEKYKKREKELLDSLLEARAMQKPTSNNTDDEKTIITDVSISLDMKLFLEECQNELNILKFELESEQPKSVVQKKFENIKKLNEEMLAKSDDCPDELQDLLNVFKCMFDLTSIMLSDDSLILELEKEKRQFQHREKTYELLVSKQDEEIKHLSDNILQYMNELAFHKNEVIKYKEMSKLESSSLDISSIITNDTKNMTEYDNDSTINQSEIIISNSDQYTQTEEDFSALIKLKEKEIEELSDQIMEYIEQLTSLEHEIIKLKSFSNAEQSIIVLDQSECINKKIQDCLIQISEYEEQVSINKAEINAKSTLVKVKDEEINVLSEKIKRNEKQINEYISQLQLGKDQISTLEEEIKSLNAQLQIEKDLMQFKNQELVNLSNIIIDYNNQLSTANTDIYNLKLASVAQEQDNNAADLMEKIISFSNQLKTVTEEYEAYKLNAQVDKNLVDIKNNEIEIFQARHSEIKGELQRLQSEIELEKIANESKDKQIEELNTQILEITERLSSVQVEIENNKSNHVAGRDLVETKEREIVELNERVTSYAKQLIENQAQYETIIEAAKHQIEEKDKYIDNLSEDKSELEAKLSKIEDELKIHESDKHEKDNMIKLKDQQIANLNSQLFEHAEKLSTLGDELEKYKSTTVVDNDLTETKDKQIQEMLFKLTGVENELNDYKHKLFAAEDKLNICESNLKREIEELSYNITYYVNNLSEAEKIINKHESDLNIQNDLVKSKNEEIEELSSNIMYYKQNLTTAEEKLHKYEVDINIQSMLINSKNEEIQELSFKITDYINQLSMATDKFNKYECELKDLNHVIHSKNKQIENLSSKSKDIEELLFNIMEYKNQISMLEDKFNLYESNLKDQNDVINAKTREIEKLSFNIIEYKNQLHVLEEKSKNKELEDLEQTLKDYEERISNLIEITKLTDYQNQELQSEKLDFDNKIIRYEDKIEYLKSNSEKTTAKYLDAKRDLEQAHEDVVILRKNYSILQTELIEKEKIISLKDSEIQVSKDLNKKRIKQLVELYKNIIDHDTCPITSAEVFDQSEKDLWHSKCMQISSEFEKLSKKLHTERTKSNEYFNRLKILDDKLQTFNEQANQIKIEHYSALNENLQKQICALQGQLNQNELALKQYKDHIDQLEKEKTKLKEDNTLLSNTSMMEIKNITETLQEKSKYIENLQKEIVSVQIVRQNNNSDLSHEMLKLKKKNEDYKKIVEQVTEKANLKIASYNNIVVKLKQENELLKVQIKSEKESRLTLQHQLTVLQGELEKKTCELSSGNEIAKLQTKVNKLDAQNKKFVKIIEDYQEQIYKKGYEESTMKKSIESLKLENTDLHIMTKDLNHKLCETEVQLKSALTNVKLLENEKENYNESSRVLEESLEDAKFELYELKNKERDKIKKIKRQSLQDSSRSLSSDERINITDENQEMHPNSNNSSNSNDSKTTECDRCKQRLPLLDRQIDEPHDKFSRLQIENENMRKTNVQLIGLCKIRKHKIDDLERQIQSYKTQ